MKKGAFRNTNKARIEALFINSFPQKKLFGLSWQASVDSVSVSGDTGKENSTGRVERTKLGPLTPRGTSIFGKIPRNVI